jgi:hypothetical protein
MTSNSLIPKVVSNIANEMEVTKTLVIQEFRGVAESEDDIETIRLLEEAMNEKIDKVKTIRNEAAIQELIKLKEKMDTEKKEPK